MAPLRSQTLVVPLSRRRGAAVDRCIGQDPQAAVDQRSLPQLLPDQDFPDHTISDQDFPDHDFPDQPVADHESPDQLLPFHRPPCQEVSARLATDHAAPSQTDPKMSISPTRSVVPSETWPDPRAASSEPWPVASGQVWMASGVGRDVSDFRSRMPAPWQLGSWPTRGTAEAVSRALT